MSVRPESELGGGSAAAPVYEGIQADEGATEERKPNSPAKVRTPIELEREDHFDSGRARYRNWRPHCVAAEGQENPRKMSVDNPSELPEIGFDYFYVGNRQSAGLPNIAAEDRATGSFAATTLETRAGMDTRCPT
jgi:hypothetical protein